MPAIHPLVQKARDLVSLITAASPEHDERRELTKPVVKALIDGGFFTMLKTKSVGGMELRPSIFAQVTEALASADGSTGWVVCQSNGCSTTSAYLIENWPRRYSPGGSYRGMGSSRFTLRGDAGRWRLLHHRQMAVHERQSERDLARRAPAGRWYQ